MLIHVHAIYLPMFLTSTSTSCLTFATIFTLSALTLLLGYTADIVVNIIFKMAWIIKVSKFWELGPPVLNTRMSFMDSPYVILITLQVMLQHKSLPNKIAKS